MSNGTDKRKWRLIAEQLGLSALVSLFVSGLISGGTLVYFESRLVNSEERTHEITFMQQQIDNAQSNMVAEFGIYATHLYDTHTVDPAKRDELLKAVSDAELQVLRLRDQMPKSDQATLESYDRQLDEFLKVVRDVKSRQDLGNAYVVFKGLLVTHRVLDAQLTALKPVSIF